MSARDEILGRVRAALTDIDTQPRPGAPDGHDSLAEGPLDVSVRGTKMAATAETLELFAENVADYRATVIRVDPEGIGAAITGALRDHGCTSVVIPSGLDPSWQEAVGAVVEVRHEIEATSSEVLDTVDAVVTASAVGIATTGTIVLDHVADQGRRELTLVPDTHVCVIRADQVVHDVPEAVSRLRTEEGHQRALTWISGPSATSDIELQRVEGVHGPRNLVVVIVSATSVSRPDPD